MADNFCSVLHMVPSGPVPTAFTQHAMESCSAQHPGSTLAQHQVLTLLRRRGPDVL